MELEILSSDIESIYIYRAGWIMMNDQYAVHPT